MVILVVVCREEIYVHVYEIYVHVYVYSFMKACRILLSFFCNK